MRGAAATRGATASGESAGLGGSRTAATCDVAVVGGGLVGVATGLALVERGAGSVVVLEAERELARHQSGRNSGVVHSGLYYAPGSLKATLCVRGREALVAFCAEHRLPFTRTGKLVVATEPAEEDALRRLAELGRANGLQGLELLDAKQLAEAGGGGAGQRALFVPETGIADFAAVNRALAERLVERGGDVRVGWRVLGVTEGNRGVRVRTNRGALEAGVLVNCAGLEADRMARRSGLRPDIRIVPFRGHYFRVEGKGAPALRVPLYPVPDPALPFLGVHVHPTIAGGVKAGPNAVLSLSRGDARLGAVCRDAFGTLAFPGFWHLARRHWRHGAAELARAWSRRCFLRAVQRLVPGIGPDDLSYAGSGIRAQAVDRDGRLIDDFHFERGERSLHVLNSPSPGATASLAIGDHVAARVVRELG